MRDFCACCAVDTEANWWAVVSVDVNYTTGVGKDSVVENLFEELWRKSLDLAGERHVRIGSHV